LTSINTSTYVQAAPLSDRPGATLALICRHQ